MENPLLRKLERFTKLSADDREALDRLASQRIRRRRHREDMIHEGDKPDHVNPILEGWACRYKMLADGRRQILAFLVPGDLCDLHVYILREMDHSIGTITPVKHAEITLEDFDRAIDGRHRVMQALWWDTLVTAAVQREWTTDIGQRSAIERIAHLLLELFYRLESVGLTNGNACELPLTQAEIAEAMGMTPVHANRVLQELRGMGVIELSSKRLVIPDRAALGRIAHFNPNYLHLQRDGSHLDAND
ncbi:Crp/Fnr family transcriptional regulator [Sphingomonas ginkgonis]|uniref:Crp/Fnr family transcriptional regulator n=1 Tax=Sphingomonas ginkgonis TaxID=2315330 RepID=A0A429VBP5_9SPHN|nr:Crp/Fnr family transcriptional regulator [Sphingomonas ginkgonis]RST31301.1 Crp/Fnr family transcriptional regulator [Sphingomonas ginkgonis]